MRLWTFGAVRSAASEAGFAGFVLGRFLRR